MRIDIEVVVRGKRGRQRIATIERDADVGAGKGTVSRSKRPRAFWNICRRSSPRMRRKSLRQIRCVESAGALPRKGEGSMVYRTAFGKLWLACPRLYAQCGCGARAHCGDSFNPLALVVRASPLPLVARLDLMRNDACLQPRKHGLAVAQRQPSVSINGLAASSIEQTESTESAQPCSSLRFKERWIFKASSGTATRLNRPDHNPTPSTPPNRTLPSLIALKTSGPQRADDAAHQPLRRRASGHRHSTVDSAGYDDHPAGRAGPVGPCGHSLDIADHTPVQRGRPVVVRGRLAEHRGRRRRLRLHALPISVSLAANGAAARIDEERRPPIRGAGVPRSRVSGAAAAT